MKKIEIKLVSHSCRSSREGFADSVDGNFVFEVEQIVLCHARQFHSDFQHVGTQLAVQISGKPRPAYRTAYQRQ